MKRSVIMLDGGVVDVYIADEIDEERKQRENRIFELEKVLKEIMIEAKCESDYSDRTCLDMIAHIIRVVLK